MMQEETMTFGRFASLSVALTLAWLCPFTTADAQSIEGAGTVPVRLSNGQGLPQGNLTIAAHIVPGTGAPTGVVRVRLPGFAEATADVDFVYVQGNAGVAGGPIRAGNALPGYTYLYLLVVDNGNGQSTDDAVAIIADGDLSELLEAFFDFFASIAGPVSHGNYNVEDGP
jgi:hypothetical protein